MRLGAGASAGASGSRRIVNLVDVRAAGESTSQGRIVATEGSVEGLTESAANGDAERVDADAATAIAAAASTGVNLDASSDSVVGHRPESMASTVLAPVSDDDTLSGTGIRPGPSRTAISWALGGIGALVAGSVAIALLSPPEAPPEAVAKATIEESVSLPVEPKRAVVDEAPKPEPAAEAESEATAEEVEEAPAATPKKSRRKARKRSTKSKKRSTKTKTKSKTKKKASSKAAKAPEPEEDDVLAQVQKYMREKKEREAKQAAAVAEAKAGRSSAPSAADKTAARDRLAQARTAYNSGKFSAAYSLAAQSQSLSASADALELMGLASCARGDADRARQVHRSIAAGRKAKIEARCRNAGIAL
jgi:outer membrane biosynthesis protein TonB